MPLASTSRTIRYQKQPPQGRGIASLLAEWAVCASSTNPPASGWQASPPQMSTAERYLWQRLTTTFTDGLPEVSKPVLVGSLGEDGVGAYALDLSNEMAAVGLRQHNGSLVVAQLSDSVSTDICLAGGRGEAILAEWWVYFKGAFIFGWEDNFDGSAEAPDGSGTMNSFTGLYSVDVGENCFTLHFDTIKPRSSGEIAEFTIKGQVRINDNGSYRWLLLSKVMTVVFQPPGADGLSPTIYQLRPNPSSVIVDSDGNTYAQSVNGVQIRPTISCEVTATTGDSVSVLSSPSDWSAAGLDLKHKVNGTELTYTGVLLLPKNISSLEWLLYKGGVLIDREDIAVVRNGAKGEDGKDGEDGTDGQNAVEYSLFPNPQHINASYDGATQVSALACSVVKTDGAEQSVITSSEAASQEGLSVRLLVNGRTTFVGGDPISTIGTLPSAIASAEWLLVKNSQVIASCELPIIKDGAPGPAGRRGAKPRFFVWGQIAAGTPLYSGADGEDWYDIIQYRDAYYMVATSFAVSTGDTDEIPPEQDFPPSLRARINKGFLEPAQQWNFMATKLFISDRAVVDNLCANFVQMVDGNGDRRFSAYIENGVAHVFADHAHFQDCAVSGVVTASQLRMSCVELQGGELLYAAFNKAVYPQGSTQSEQTTFYLPMLEKGASQTIRVMLAGEEPTLADTVVMTLLSDCQDVRIVKGARIGADNEFTKMEITQRLGLYQLTGWRADYDGSPTYWNVTLVDGVEPTTNKRDYVPPANPSIFPDYVWGFIDY